MIELQGNRFRSGIFSINDRTGNAAFELGRWRQASQNVARAFGADELELIGLAVINSDLYTMLKRLGFTEGQEVFPDYVDLVGGETIMALSRVFLVR